MSIAPQWWLDEIEFGSIHWTRQRRRMSEKMISEKDVSSLVQCLASHPDVDAAYVMGSAVTGGMRDDSDFDLAILSGRGFLVPERLLLTAELSKIVGRTVDLGLLTTANLVYAKEAVARGRLVYERDHRITARFEMLVLSMYAALQEARREVLRAYAA